MSSVRPADANFFFSCSQTGNLEWYDPDNIYTEGGHLVVELTKESKADSHGFGCESADRTRERPGSPGMLTKAFTRRPRRHASVLEP